jgi:glutaredoxin
VLTELGLTYMAVNVAANRDERANVIAVSGQDTVPTLQDGDKVFTDSNEMIEYLQKTYPVPDDAEDHAAFGAWRAAGALSLPPRAALAHLRELLEAKGFTIVSQIRGPKINERLPKEYVLLYVTIPVAAVKTVQIDPLAPGALLLPMAVMPADGGGSIIATADPVGQVWLYGEPELNAIQSKVKERLVQVFEEL